MLTYLIVVYSVMLLWFACSLFFSLYTYLFACFSNFLSLCFPVFVIVDWFHLSLISFPSLVYLSLSLLASLS